MIPVFLGSDILLEQSLENGAIHIIERRCRLAIDAPYLLKKVHLGIFKEGCVIDVYKLSNIPPRNLVFSCHSGIM